MARERPPWLTAPEATSLFAQLGSAARPGILVYLLERGEACVGDLAAATGQPRLVVSKQLARLRYGGLVEARPDRKRRLYRSPPDQAAGVVGVLRAAGVIG